MCSSEDCEKLWFLYKLEGEPKGVSIEQFCIKQGVPYQVFNKWFRDRKKRIVPVEIVGRDEDSKPEVEAEEKKAEGPKRASCVKYVKLVFGNELRIEKKNLSYHELKELVEKLVDKGYRFMRIVTEGYKRVYKVEWKDVLAILESPVIKEYKLKKEIS